MRSRRWVVGALAAALALAGVAPVGAAPGTATVVNTQLADSGGAPVLSSGLVAFVVSEADQSGSDLNGDGDTTDFVAHVFDPLTGTSTNTGLGSGGFVAAVGARVAFTVSEADQAGTDLNGDGDTNDSVVHVFDPATGTSASTGLAWVTGLVAVGNRVAFNVSEADQAGTDLNGDGDTNDWVAHVFDPVTGVTTNSGVASFFTMAVGGRVALDVSEKSQGNADLNADGDTDDSVAYFLDAETGMVTNSGLAWAGGFFAAVGDRVAFEVSEADQGMADLNGDGDASDSVVHVFDPATGTGTNSGLAAGFLGLAAVGDHLLFGVSEVDQGGTDLNGDGDTADSVVYLAHISGAATSSGLAADGPVVAMDSRVAFPVSEADQGGTDLNGDGDATDSVVYLLDPATGTATSSGLAWAGTGLLATGGQATFAVSERDQGDTDLNGDGDATDNVIHAFDPVAGTATSSDLAADILGGFRAAGSRLVFGVPEAGQGGADLNGDGDAGDFVVHVFEPIATSAFNLELAVDPSSPRFRARGSVVAVSVPESHQGNADLNGDGDNLDMVQHVVTLNTAPVAVDDGPFEVAEGATLRVNGVLDNDSDEEGDALTAVKMSDPTHGTLNLEPDGSFTYVHDGSETTSDSFSYKANDGTADSNVATVSFTVTPVNDPPVAVADGPYTVAEGATLDRAAPGVLDNDTDPEADSLTAVKVTDPAHGTLSLDADGSFTYVNDGSDTTSDSFTYTANDGTADSNVATVTIAVTPVDDSPVGHTVGLVDPSQGRWHLRDSTGVVSSFFYGNPGDIPFMGDWDCDGDDTPGLFRQSDAFAYLRNANTVGIADIRFFFGNPSDVPLAGDFDGDGCDTVSIYRPAEQRFYIINRLGENEGGLGAAEFVFTFGNPGDKPVVGDWDDDGIDEVGLHREATGFFYWRNTLDTGIADGDIFFGDPGDRFVAGDWGIVDGADTPAVFRPTNMIFFFRHTLTQGIADSEFSFGEAPWLPVAGEFRFD